MLAEVVSSVMDVVPAVVAVVDPGVGEAPPGSGGFETIIKWAANIGLGLGVFGIIAIGALMCTSFGRRHAAEHIQALIVVGCGCVVIAGAGGIVKALTGA